MDKRPRVVVLGCLPPERGISAYCRELAEAVGRIAPIDFIGFKQMYPAWLYPGGDLRPDPTLPNPDPTRVHARRLLAWYNPLSWIAEGTRVRGDILHVQFWSLPIAPILATVMILFRLRRIPVVVTVHNLEAHDHGSLPFRWASRLLIRLAQGVIVHSDKLRNQAIQRFQLPPDRVWSIPAGTFPAFVDDQLSTTAARQRLGLPADRPLVLFFGAIREYKGLADLLEAFAQLRDVLPTAQLLVAGKLWEPWQPYADRIQQLGIADALHTHLQYIPADEVKFFFAAADVVAMPYRHFDAQSGVGLVAVTFGKPAVVSDVGGLPELVRDPQAVVPVGDAPRLAAALARVLKHPEVAQQLACDAQQVAAAHQWDAIAAKTWQVYQEILSRHRRIK